MQAMTPEQNEAWQKAVMQAFPIPMPDGQECSFEQWRNHRIAELAMLSLLPESEQFALLGNKVRDSAARLADWHLPDWTLEVRATIHHKPELAFRSDVALIGIQFRYPAPEARTEPYQRLLLGFLYGVFHPLVECAEASNDIELRQDLEGLAQICQLCKSDEEYLEPKRWLDIKNAFGQIKPRVTFITRAPDMVHISVRLANQVLFHINEPDPHNTIPTGFLMRYTPSGLHCPALDYDYKTQAFLEVLEAECPPPDWLPRI